MRRARLLLPLLAVALVVAALPSVASARAPGLARVEGTGLVDFTARGRAQLFGEVDHGRLLWQGRGNPRVVSCADARPLKRCAIKRETLDGTEWVIYKPARIFVLSRNYRLLLAEGGTFQISITGTGTLSVDGSGRMTVATGETHDYAGREDVQLESTRRTAPRRLP